jgi:hypothetical protein
VTRWWKIIVVTLAAMAAMASLVPSSNVAATAPPTTEAPVVTNDLLPQNNDVSNCVGTVESANCGSKARADGHTYLVFLALTLGLAFIGWRIARGVKARDAAHEPAP